MTEKSYYAKITKYYNAIADCSMAVELKITKGNTLSFKCLPPHQEEFLVQSGRTLGYKIDDTGRRKKPFDIFVLYHAFAVIVAIFYRPRDTEIYEIGIKDFLNEKYNSGKKSLTLERARQIGSRLPI